MLCSCCAVGAHTRGLVNTNNSVGWHSGSRMTSAMPVYTHRSTLFHLHSFFAFPLGKFEKVQLNEWCEKKATECDDPKGRSMSEKLVKEKLKKALINAFLGFFVHSFFTLVVRCCTEVVHAITIALL